MKMGRKINAFLCKTGYLLLAFIFLSGALLVGMPVTASAAETVTEGGLPSDPTQSDQAEALGLPTDQPSRISPSGDEVDKSESPFGPSNLTYYGIN